MNSWGAGKRGPHKASSSAHSASMPALLSAWWSSRFKVLLGQVRALVYAALQCLC
jgi:hypothetical protein